MNKLVELINKKTKESDNWDETEQKILLENMLCDMLGEIDLTQNLSVEGYPFSSFIIELNKNPNTLRLRIDVRDATISLICMYKDKTSKMIYLGTNTKLLEDLKKYYDKITQINYYKLAVDELNKINRGEK